MSNMFEVSRKKQKQYPERNKKWEQEGKMKVWTNWKRILSRVNVRVQTTRKQVLHLRQFTAQIPLYELLKCRTVQRRQSL